MLFLLLGTSPNVAFLLEILAEFLLQVLLEALAEIGLHSLKEPFKRPPNPWLASVGYALFGCLAGAFSLWLVPHHFITKSLWRVVNVVGTPIAVGLTMSLIGAWRTRKGWSIVRLDRFSYGFLFALTIALIRFFYAH